MFTTDEYFIIKYGIVICGGEDIMGFDLGHTISSLSKLALRTKRRLDSDHTKDNDSIYQIIYHESSNNKLIKKYEGYTQNKKFKVGLSGRTVYIYDHEENELTRFQDVSYMYRGKFIPNTNILVVKSTSGWLLFYGLDKLELIKKLNFQIWEVKMRILILLMMENIYIILKPLKVQRELN